MEEGEEGKKLWLLEVSDLQIIKMSQNVAIR
jgi:hypothetical protein